MSLIQIWLCYLWEIKTKLFQSPDCTQRIVRDILHTNSPLLLKIFRSFYICVIYHRCYKYQVMPWLVDKGWASLCLHMMVTGSMQGLAADYHALITANYWVYLLLNIMNCRQKLGLVATNCISNLQLTFVNSKYRNHGYTFLHALACSVDGPGLISSPSRILIYCKHSSGLDQAL